jgi:hypothetical protein
MNLQSMPRAMLDGRAPFPFGVGPEELGNCAALLLLLPILMLRRPQALALRCVLHRPRALPKFFLSGTAVATLNKPAPHGLSTMQLSAPCLPLQTQTGWNVWHT